MTYVYVASLHYDAWESFNIAFTSTLALAKREAQCDLDRYDAPDKAPRLQWEKLGKPWVALVNSYGREYHIRKVEVLTK